MESGGGTPSSQFLPCFPAPHICGHPWKRTDPKKSFYTRNRISPENRKVFTKVSPTWVPIRWGRLLNHIASWEDCKWLIRPSYHRWTEKWNELLIHSYFFRWRVLGTFSTTPTARFIENVYGDGKNGKVCGTWNTPNVTAEYNSILLIGSQDLDTPAIQFHTRARFYGEPDLFLDGRILRLQKPMSFSSYGFTGRHNWTLFRTTDLTGHSECLVANGDHAGDFMVTFNVNKSMTVGSIWRGCGALDPKVLGRQALEGGGGGGGRTYSATGLMLVGQGLLIFVGIYIGPFYSDGNVGVF